MDRHANLSEGMRRFDLEDLVMPLLSVDEFESKVDDSAVVFGFYVRDQSAATDLNRFLQKSPVEVLDTDISPAPDQRGYFMVFVEMTNDDLAAKNIASICEDIKNLTNIKQWQMRVRGNDRLLPLDPGVIVKHLKRERRANQQTGVLEYLEPSELRSARLDESYLTLNGRESFHVIDFADLDFLLEAYDLKEQALATDEFSRWQCKRVRALLGEAWNVDAIGAYHIISRDDASDALLLKR